MTTKVVFIYIVETGKDNQKLIANNDLYETQIVTSCMCMFSFKYKHLIAFKKNLIASFRSTRKQY